MVFLQVRKAILSFLYIFFKLLISLEVWTFIADYAKHYLVKWNHYQLKIGNKELNDFFFFISVRQRSEKNVSN